MDEVKESVKDGEDLGGELALTFIRFWSELDSQVELLNEVVPAIFDRRAQWDDVRSVAPELKIPEDRVEEFRRTLGPSIRHVFVRRHPLAGRSG